jgi:hypothetical protein
LFEEWGVTGIHIIKTHGRAVLVGVLRRRPKAIVMVAYTGCLRDPDKQILPVAVAYLLPHLKEAVHRVTDEIAIGCIARNLERAVGEIIGKTGSGTFKG